jgi:hypothetical protein
MTVWAGATTDFATGFQYSNLQHFIYLLVLDSHSFANSP